MVNENQKRFNKNHPNYSRIRASEFKAKSNTDIRGLSNEPIVLSTKRNYCNTCGRNFTVSGNEIDKQRCDSCEDNAISKLTSNQAKMLKNTNKTFAKDGFRGKVSMKTLFTVGEGGKKEHVTRKKSNNIFDVGGF